MAEKDNKKSKKSIVKKAEERSSVENRLYCDKGTIIRLTFHAKSGNVYKVNPLMHGASGWVRGMPPENKVLPYQTTLASVHDNTFVFIDKSGRQVHTLVLDLKEWVIGITSLVLYLDGSTWEGLIGDNIPEVKAMIWCPNLANQLPKTASAMPWSDGQDWKKVPTAMLIQP